MVNSLHTQANREKIINTQQSSGTPLPLEKLLRNELYTAESLVRTGIPKRVKEGKARKAQAVEQLRVLKAFDPAIVRLVERVNVRRFREETRRMKVQS
jgi:hypothetical protein